MKKIFICVVLLSSFACYSSEQQLKAITSEDTSTDLSYYMAQGQLAKLKRDKRRKDRQACCCFALGTGACFWSESIYPAAPAVPYVAGGLLYVAGAYFFKQAVYLNFERKKKKYKQD